MPNPLENSVSSLFDAFGGRPPAIAIVEDDPDLREELEYHFNDRGFDVWGVESAELFYRTVAVHPVDLVIIDRGLPGESGTSLVEHLAQQRKHALVILSAKGSVTERIEGLQAGADLYFPKPFSFLELEIAVQNLLMRYAAGQSFAAPARKGESGARWDIDLAQSQLIAPNKKTVPITGREIELLELLMAAHNTLVTKADLMRHFKITEEEDWHRINAAVYRLRRKTETETGMRLPLRAVFGRGLCFVNG